MPSSAPGVSSAIAPRALLRTALRLAVLSLLSACATHSSPQMTDESREASEYAKRAAGDYRPPGPPEDPWGPYITEASHRFDVPDRWIREVMRVESGGNEFLNGQLTTSPVGAMGLMQVMPQTYDELKIRYALGEDAYDPHNNVLAGAAYIREMYDLYGAPAFLAAYNAGPGRVDDYMQHSRPLPQETRRYLAMIAPFIQETYPNSRSAADQLAMNLPGGFDYVPVPRFPHNPRGYEPPAVVMAQHRMGIHPAQLHLYYPVRYANTYYMPRYAHAAPGSRAARSAHGRVQYAAVRVRYVASPQRGTRFAQLAPPRATRSPPQGYLGTPTARVQMAVATPHSGTFRLVSQAMADPSPPVRGGRSTGKWAIQVGAYSSRDRARASAETVRVGRGGPAEARPVVGAVHDGRSMLYRARLTGLSHSAAVHTCERLGRGRSRCLVLSPAGQS
jgi:hypothetical protein